MRPSSFRPQSVLSPEGAHLLQTESLIGLLEARGVIVVDRSWEHAPIVMLSQAARIEGPAAGSMVPLLASVKTTCRATLQLVIPAEHTLNRMTMGAFLREACLRKGMRLSHVLAYGDE